MYKLYIIFLLIICSKAYNYTAISLRTFIDNCQLPNGCKIVEILELISNKIDCYNLRSTINLDNCDLKTRKNTTVKPIYLNVNRKD